MKELNEEQYNQLPEFVQEDYVLDGDSYKHAGVLKMKGTLNDLNGKLESQKGEYNQLNSRLSEFEQNKKAEIEKARADALEQAKNKGEVADIEKLYEERIADAEKRAAELARAEVTKEYEQKSLKQTADMELTEIVAGLKPKDDFSARLIRDHLQARRTIEDGKIIYFNEDGGASSLDKNGLLAELRDSGKFNALSSYEPIVQGGGNLRGSDGSGAPSGTPKTLEECKGDRKLEAAFFNSQLTG